MEGIERQVGEYLRMKWAVTVIRVIGWLVPVVLGAITLWTSLAQKVPISLLVMMTTLTVAAALVAVNQIRVLVGAPIAVRSFEDYSHGLGMQEMQMVTGTQGLGLRIVLINSAPAAIRYEVQNVAISLGNRTLSERPKYTNMGTVIPRGQARTFTDVAIGPADVEAIRHESVEGRAEFVIRYGRPDGRLSRELRLDLKLNCFVDAGQFHWVFEKEADVAV